jgi:AcrR family transcriptional regulator
MISLAPLLIESKKQYVFIVNGALGPFLGCGGLENPARVRTGSVEGPLRLTKVDWMTLISPPPPPSRSSRRSQAERSTESRERLLSAAIRLLKDGGYSAASVKAIAAEAGMSLGSLQHHFPTKAKLMTAVVERLAEKRLATYQAQAEVIADPLARYISSFDSTWALVKEPEFVAVLEILLARRSDPELWSESEAAIEATEAFLKQWVSRLAADVGDPPAVAQFRRSLSNTFLYGLAMQLTVGMDPAEAEELAKYWKALTILAGGHPEILPRYLWTSPSAKDDPD